MARHGGGKFYSSHIVYESQNVVKGGVSGYNGDNPMAEFLSFGIKQARACVFAGSFFLLLFISRYVSLGIPRYDFLFLAALGIQYVLYKTGLETKDEIKVIFLFHLLGLALELFKTHPAIGSWSYPGEGYLKIASVPLYSGFMYAAIGSYISQAWKLMKVEMVRFPPYRWSIPLAAAIYLNFFTHHFIPDFRWILSALVVIVFWKTRVFFTPDGERRSMPLTLSFILVAFFIWVAENISTYLGAWKYPYQLREWTLVSFDKISSWSLLVIISFIIVADLKMHKKIKTAARAPKP